MTLRKVGQRALLAFIILFLAAVAWGTISGALNQFPRALTVMQRVETGVQFLCGALSVLAVLTIFRWQQWGARVRTAWGILLAITVALSSLVWGPPLPLVALLFAACALLLARGVSSALRFALGGSTARLVPDQTPA